MVMDSSAFAKEQGARFDRKELHANLADLSRGISAQVSLVRGSLKACSEVESQLEHSVSQLAHAVEVFEQDIIMQVQMNLDVALLKVPLSPSIDATSAPTMSASGSRSNLADGEEEIWPFWQEVSKTRSRIQRTSSAQATISTQFGDHEGRSSAFGAVSTGHHGACSWVMLRPGSVPKLVWDCLIAVMICYDLLSLPLMVFGYDDLPIAKSLRLGTASFWAADFCMNFLQGYQIDGRIEMSPKAIARRYLRTWLVPDALLLALDWFLIMSQVESGLASIARLGKTGRFLRVLRLVRLMQFAKFTEVLTRLTDAAFDAKGMAALMIAKLLVLLGCICHFVGCAWYAVGTVGQRDLSVTWVAPLAAEGASMTHRYLVCFHWAFSQFTPSSSPYHPKTLREELFNVSLLGLGFVLFTSSLGNITSTITAVQKSTAERNRERSLLKRYLSERHVSWKLGQQIITFFRHHRKKRQEVLECDVTLVRSLPENLLRSLRGEIRGPVIANYPVFKYISNKYPAVLQAIAHKVAVQKTYSAGQEVFSYGSSSLCMRFVFSGLFEYHPSAELVVLPEQYCPGTWIGEAALWTRGQHGGHLIAKVHSSLLELEAKAFHATVSWDNALLEELRQYAQYFAGKLQESGDPAASHIADTFKDEHGVEELFGGTASQQPLPHTNSFMGKSSILSVTRGRAGWGQRSPCGSPSRAGFMEEVHVAAAPSESKAQAVGDANSSVLLQL